MIYKAISEHLSNRRIQHTELARKSQIPCRIVQSMLNGRHPISPDHYQQICLALNVPVDTFYRRSRGAS